MNRRRTSLIQTLTDTSAAVAFTLAPTIGWNSGLPTQYLGVERFTPGPNIPQTAADSTLDPSQQLPAGMILWVESDLWFKSIRQNVANLLDLSENWDSFGASAIKLEYAESALSLLQSIMDSETLTPSIVPTSVGGLQMEWHAKGIDLEVEVESISRVNVFYEDSHRGVSWEDELSTDLSKLTEAVTRLRREPIERA
jgi:hypothetical protein